ncbi:hypothetical protein IJD34_05995 [bacterium]|nr:hypothetical protein [bacterium]
MALINIEYGSLASSDTMNKNFIYLEDKIAENSESVMTSISSILSNIATINSRLADLAEDVSETNLSLNSKIEDYKLKTKLLVNLASMVPNWAECYSVDLNSEFVAPSNGYLLIIPYSNAQGNLLVNDTEIKLKVRASSDDNAAELMSIPLYEGDRAYSTMNFNTIYFLPSKEISLEEF